MRSAALQATLGALALTAATVVPAAAPHHAAGAPPPPPRSPGGLPLPLREAREAVGAARAAEAAAARGIDWHRCADPQELPATARCGEISVPVDYTEPEGEQIPLAVSRKRATGPAREHQGPLIHNPGGPGADGTRFPLYGTLRGGVWQRLNRAYDFIGYAPRGVGRSAPLRCHDPYSASPYTGDDASTARSPRTPSEAYKRELRRHAAAFAEDCALRHGARLARFTTADNARDLDVLRAALHRERTTFTGTSYGAYLGAVYATLFPERVRRLVLDSAVDPRPERIGYRNALAQSEAFQRRWRDFTYWIARHHRVYGLGATAQAVGRRFDEARRALDDGRVSGFGGRRPGSRRLLSAYLDAGYSDESWPRLASALAEFHEGDPRALTEVAAPFPRASAQQANGDAVFAAVQCSEGEWPRGWRRWDRDGTALARSAPLPAWEGVRANLPCAYWSGRPARPVDVGARTHGPPHSRLPPVLLLASTRDAATPYEGTVETWKRLPGSSLVTEAGAGTHGVAGGNACADRHLAAYLLQGRVPGRAAACPPRHGPRAER